MQTIKAEQPVYGGYVIGRDGKVVFIKGAIPGELVEVEIEEKKKDYYIASVKGITEPSLYRRKPPCSIFGECGGCQLQYITHEKQVSMKEEILLDTMRRIAAVDIQLRPSITGKEFGYRHRGQFKVSQDGETGFYREGTREIIPVEECPLMIDKINQALQTLKGIDIKGAKELHIVAGDTVSILLKGAIPENSEQSILDSGISGIAFENGTSLGKDYITLDLHGLKYSVTPWSFFQSHWSLNQTVVDAVISSLGPLDNKRVLDLYSGAGNFSIPLSVHAAEVLGIEGNLNAVEDAKRNAALNGIKNCSFINLSAEESFGSRRKHKHDRLFKETGYDIIILDPPRAGLTSDCLKGVMELNSSRIVYISCNPATLARDVKKMKEKYEIESLTMMDFFPNTYHIEALAYLNLK